MGGWYNDFKMPFNRTFRATIKSHVSTLRTNQTSCP